MNAPIPLNIPAHAQMALRRWSPLWRKTLLIPSLIMLVSPLVAQTAPEVPVEKAPKAKGSLEEPILKLTPFVVNADTETGWVATESLAGSRLRTNLSDLAAPIEVLTMDFMNEFGLTSYADATIYTTNVEGFGDNLELGPGLGLGTGFPPPVRVRGLSNATLSRDFFAVQMPMDNYNIDRVTIAAGPNNLLFGLGNPAGVIDGSLKRAQYRNFNKVSLLFDSNQTERAAIDINREIVKDKLALRFNTVYENKGFEYKPSHYDHRRLYGALDFSPFKSTNISVNYESVQVDNMRPSLTLPFDRISPWFTAASIPGWTHTTNSPVYTNVAINPAAANFGFGAVSALNRTVFERSPGWTVMMIGPNSTGLDNKVINLRNTVRIIPAFLVPTTNALSQQADGFTLLDDTYYSDRTNIGGLSRKERVDSTIGNVFITQKVGKHLYFELAGQKQSYFSRNAGMFSYVDAFTVHVDPNRFLADGVTANPNLGKFYVEGSPYQTKTKYEAEDWRLTGSYEVDFSKDGGSWWRDLLGKQRLVGLISGNSAEQRVGEYFARIVPKGGLTGRNPVFSGAAFNSPLAANGSQITNWITQQSRVFMYRYYLNGDVPVPTQNLFAPIQITDDTGEVFTIDMENTGLVDGMGRRLGAGRVSALKNWVKTRQLAYQGFFWDNRVSATLGWREDTTNAGDIADGGNIAHVSGLFPVIEDLGFVFNPDNEQTGSTRTTGLVVRPLKGWLKLPFAADVSLAWNRSNTFQPNVATVDPFGNRYPGAAGFGEDKSIRLGLWQGKFTFHYTEYVDTAGPTRAANVPFNRFRFGLAAPINRVKQLAGLTQPLTLYNNNLGFNAGGDGLPYSVMSFQRASGDELGLDWNVTKNLQIRFNMNRQTVVESQIGRDWFAWMDLEQPKYAALTFPEGGINNPRDLDGNGSIGTWTWDTAWIADNDPQTIKQIWDNSVIAQGKKLIESLDGKSNDFVRDNRYNIMAVYRFTEGRLKGLSVGGAYRFRAAPLVGYAFHVFEGQPSIDITQPYYGKAESLFDLSINYANKNRFLAFKEYRVGLNVRNLLDNSDNYVQTRGVNGEPTRIGRVAEGRTFVLTIAFDL